MDLCLNQTAVWWKRLGLSGGEGRYLWDDPAEIMVRWQDTNERFVNAQGEDVRSVANVFFKEELSVGDYLYLGTLDELTSAADPSNSIMTLPIRRISKTPDLSGTDFVRFAWL